MPFHHSGKYRDRAEHPIRSCGLVLGDGTQIHQIGMNLITNAYHAVQDAGGRISVYLKEIRLDSEFVPFVSLKTGTLRHDNG